MPESSIRILIACGLVMVLTLLVAIIAVVRAEKPFRVALLVVPGLILMGLCLSYFVYAAIRPLFSF